VAAFPRDLAKVVLDRWHNVVAGEYVIPPCPPLPQLRQLMEACYLAASSPDEARYPQFNVIAVPREHFEQSKNYGTIWQFRSARPLSVGELRRLAPTVDLRKSAILVTWDKQEWSIAGLLDLGTSWHRARLGLSYRYRHPGSLLVQIDRPGRMRVYQGEFHVATLLDGQIDATGISFSLFLHKPANAGLMRMASSIYRPVYEHPKEFTEFEFIAIWNTYAAIANTISLDGHGGMLIIVPGDRAISEDLIKVKYENSSTALRDSFIYFINARHVVGDHMELMEHGHCVPDEALLKAELAMTDSYEALVEATRFIAGLSGCDGSIVVSDDLRLLGFGGEIGSSAETVGNSGYAGW
jgi:hypothetical protein